jgi:signal peptidase I
VPDGSGAAGHATDTELDPSDAETPSRRGGRQQAAKEGHSFLAELPVLVLIAFVLALLLKTFLIQAFYIPSESMLPTLETGDRVLVNKVVYELRDPSRGEVVVFRDNDVTGAEDVRTVPQRILDFLTSGLGAPANERDFIKRIIGLPGDVIEVRDFEVLVNGQPLPEELASEGGYLFETEMGQTFGPFTVPEDSYFVMGDNRRNSADSRSFLGTIPREDLIGRAFVVIWPVTRIDTLPIVAGTGDD